MLNADLTRDPLPSQKVPDDVEIRRELIRLRRHVTRRFPLVRIMRVEQDVVSAFVDAELEVGRLRAYQPHQTI